ncbi:MAG: hypothetical protein DDT19_01928 [Syntrophomonadaceae bacterium]|nr:hypothetical protein [Bacillota bacterium]
MHTFVQNTVVVTPPKRPKKITGTRFTSVLGMDRWNSPFKTWCAITKTYEEPFVDTKFTIAGKAIEPKIRDYLNKVYYFGNLKSPEDIYGKDYFNKTFGDFFKDNAIFGGMWDALHYEQGKITSVIEIKTTKRAEDWQHGPTELSVLQTALYAHLLKIDSATVVVSFLEEKDYENPEQFIPSSDNTLIYEIKVSDRLPQFSRHIKRATDWWHEHVETGVSPVFEEERDTDILKELRKNSIASDTYISDLMVEGEALKAEIEAVTSTISQQERRLKVITDLIKQHCMTQFREGDTKVSLTGKKFIWEVSRVILSTIDKSLLIQDGVLEKYSIPTESYRITQKPIDKVKKER